ncbi:Extradiol dioxygenase [Flavobacterium sp. 9AF]|uniref:VOC family protein n=1 Tax=Flavobacterium sp. 9AF TaxID=2653142 RepID=UPI0012F2B886|nr:glyoxalase/bleomycin resistance/extradiol dioxygenase family protein [Flavobacterium sp. 9AF]VXB67342.1 Extradiol dioxygenase [Flavobacterium sp. 9AF]
MKQIFINLPVKNTAIAQHFYTQIGFTLNPLFTFENQISMNWGDQIFIMLQTYEMFFSKHTKSPIDTQTHPLVTFTLPIEKLETINTIMEKGLQAGGTEIFPPISETFMQGRNIKDQDGNQWCLLYLNIQKFKESVGK